MKIPQFKNILLIVIFLPLFCSWGQTEINKDDFTLPETFSSQLPNLLNYSITPIPNSNIVAVNIRVHTGSANEENLIGSGVTHFLEHLVFKSTLKYKLGQIEEKIKEIGAKINAQTSQDTTSFFITAPKEHIETALDILREMLFFASLNEEDIAKEKEVVIKEMNMRRDNPQFLLYENLWQKAAINHPYQYPVLGYKQLFSKLTAEQIKKYYKKHYSPNRMSLAIVGDISLQKAKTLVKKYFADLPAGEELEPKFYPLVHWPGVREFKIATSTSLAHIAMVFPSFSLLNYQSPIADLIALILGSGKNSRLYKKLVEKEKVAYSVEVSNYTPQYPGLFVIECTLPEENINKTKKIILTELNRITKQFVSEKEVEKAKLKMKHSLLKRYQSFSSIAAAYTYNQLIAGDINFDYSYLQQALKATPKQIKTVAQNLFNQLIYTLVCVVPEKSKKEEAKNIPFTSLITEKNNYSYLQLKNGIKIVAVKNSLLPLTSVSIAIKGGLIYEPEGKQGISELTSRLLLAGTKHLPKEKLLETLEEKSIDISPFNGRESFGLNANLPSGQLITFFKLVKDILRYPLFPENKIQEEKTILIKDIRLAEENIFAYGFKLMRKHLFPNHPYGEDPWGSKTTIEKISRKDILNFYQNQAKPENIVICIVANIDPQKIIAFAKKYFQTLPSAPSRPLHLPKELKKLPRDIVIEEKMDKKQALFIQARQGPGLFSSERYALQLLSQIMSGSTGRIFKAIRNQEGLSYTQNFIYAPLPKAGIIAIYIATTKEKLTQAEKILSEEINQLIQQGVKEEELTSAKKELLTQYYEMLTNNSSLSFQLALYTLYGYSPDYLLNYPEKIKAINLTQLQQVIEKYIANSPKVEIIITPNSTNN